MIEERSVSIVMPVHNQEVLIGKVMRGILDNISEYVTELLIILDACTDRSETVILRSLVNKTPELNVKLIYAPDIWEVKSCNIGFKSASGRYILNIQDDMIVKEKNFDQILMKPFFALDNVFAVTARDAVDCRIKGEEVEFLNVFGRDVGSPKGVFGVRTIVNRGPLMIDAEKLKELDYLDEAFAPITQDETDLSLRSLKKGWITGAYMIDYESDLEWGGTRKSGKVSSMVDEVQRRNMKLLIEKHGELLSTPRLGREFLIE